jgi:DNA-binding MarR family transcriptional regulator
VEDLEEDKFSYEEAAEILEEPIPPSGKLVYKVLEYQDEPLSQSEIGDESRLSERTVRHALSELEGYDLVQEFDDLQDGRRNLYLLNVDQE